MNEQETIRFILENSSEPVIKNPVMRAALQEPRTMAQEPRNMYSQGQLVQNTADGSRPGYDGDTTTRNKIIKFLEGKKEIHSTELIEFLDKKRFTGQRASDMKDKKWFKDLNIEYIQDPNPMLYGEKKGRLNIPKARKTVYNKYAALFHKEQPKEYLSANWSDLTYNQRQDISSIAKSNDYKFRVNYSRRKRFNPTKEKKLIDVFELTEQNFLDHGKYGVKRSLANGKTNPEYTKIHNYVQNDFKFPKKDLLPVKMQRQIMNTFDLPEGVPEWKFDEYKYGVPDTRGKNMNLGKRIANSLRETKSWKISTDWSKPNGWMMYSMYRASNNDMRLPNGKLAYEPKYETIDGAKKVIGFTDNTAAGGGKTYYGLKKWNKKYKGTDWANHGDFKKTSKFVDITKRAYAQPNEVIKGLLEKGGIPRNGKLQLNHVLKFLAQQEGYDIERLKNAIVKHHMGGVGAGQVIGNPTNDLQILKVTTNNAIREIENKIRKGTYLKDDITALKNYGASVRGPDGRLYGGGSRTAIGGFKAIEKGAETSIRNWNKKDFNEFNKYLQSFCGYGKSTGGRIGFGGGSCSPEVAKKNFLIATNDVRTGRVTGEAAEQIAKNAGKVVAKAGSKSVLASIFGPAGIGIDIAYEVGSIGIDMYAGKPWKEAVQDNWIAGAFMPGTGQEEFHKALFEKHPDAKPYGSGLDLKEAYDKKQKQIGRLKAETTYRGKAEAERQLPGLERDLRGIAAQYNALGSIMEEGSPEYENYMATKTEFEDSRKATSQATKAKLKMELDRPTSDRAVPYKRGEPVKIDFSLPKPVSEISKTPLNADQLQEYAEYHRNVGDLEPRGELPQWYVDEIQNKEKWRQEFEQRGIRGSQDWKGATGGIANLKIKW